MSRRARWRKVGRVGLTYAAIVVATLAILDGVLIATGLFPPKGDYGHPTLGWVSVDPTGSMEVFPCGDPFTGQRSTIQRNEWGYRTPHSEVELRADTTWFEIAVTGDSHTDQCMTNEEMHFGFMVDELTGMGIETAAFSYGAGRYSPLQEYLAVLDGIEEFEPDALVVNLYTGNDFYDILRIDDRPHFVRVEGGYEIAPPVWYQYDDPERPRRSRVFFALGKAAERTGVPNLWTRFRYLSAAARDQGSGLGAVFSYFLDLRKATSSDAGYSAAFAAQILNQQLFFHHFQGSEEESLRRVGALLRIIRERHPELMLVMSPIPSYQLVGETPVDPALLDVLTNLPLTYESGVEEERRLFNRLRLEAEESGWLFVDNLSALQAYEGPERLYNDFDYHVTVPAMEVIGRNEARAIAAWLDAGR